MLNCVKRYRMYRVMKRLESDLLFKNRLTLDECLPFSRTKSDIWILKELDRMQCLNVRFNSSGAVISISLDNSKGSIYTLERSEVWMNRILGFIAGLLTAFATGWVNGPLS